MSIYSGFATRNLESSYNKGVGKLLQLMQDMLVKVMRKGREYSEKLEFEEFGKEFLRIYKGLRGLELQKHLQPNFTEYCVGIARELGGDESVKTFNDNASFVNINTEVDFHILNDVMAYDTSRVGTRGETRFIKRKITTGRAEKQGEISGFSKRKLMSRGQRVESTRTTPNLVEISPNRGYSSIAKKSKRQNLSPALLYHEQAMELLHLNYD